MSKARKIIEEKWEDAWLPEEERPYEVSENWAWFRLGSLVNIKAGKKDASHGNKEGAYPFFTCAAAPIRSDTYSFEGEAVLLPGNGANVGLVLYYNGKFEAYQRTYVLTSEKVSMKYVYYHLLLEWNRHNKDKQFGSTTNYIKLANIQDYKLPLAPPGEQKRIVKKVERLFVKVEEAARIIEEVRESVELRRASILDRAFRGELNTNLSEEKSVLETVGQWIKAEPVSENTQPYHIPKNWAWLRLKDFLPPMVSRDPAKLHCKEFLYIDIDSIDNRKFTIKEPKLIDVSEAPNRARRAVHQGDVIISLVRPYLMNVAQVLSDDPALVASTAFYVCRKNKVVQADYLYYYLLTPSVTNELNIRAKGHNAPSVRNKEFLELKIPVPPVEEQERIAKKIAKLLDALSQEVHIISEVEEKLDTVKQGILNKAFRGELETDETERGSEEKR